MERALVTGVDGFTGWYLRLELQGAGYRVFGTVHHPGATDPDVHVVDLCDRDRVREVVNDVQPDIVAHLAAISFVAHGDTDAIYRVNLLGSRHLLEALAGAGRKPASILLASSANVYGNAGVEPIDESAPAAPRNDYAVSKLSMEYLARLWMERLPITIVRPFNYTGVGQAQNFLLPKIVSHFREHKPVIELGNTEIARDFSDVRTVALAYRRLLRAAPAGEMFNICSGVAHTLSEVLRMMEAIAGYAIQVKVNPRLVRSNEVARLRGSNAKLTGIIGRLPAIPLQETLQWMYSAPPSS